MKVKFSHLTKLSNSASINSRNSKPVSSSLLQLNFLHQAQVRNIFARELLRQVLPLIVHIIRHILRQSLENSHHHPLLAVIAIELLVAY